MDVAADPLGMDVEIDYQAQLQRFGLSTFRPGQQQVLDAINAGRDCLCIMPTGGGKSLCFQLPAISRDGTVLVISPLIALMKDQVDALVQLNISATYINSSLGSAEQRDRISSMAQNRYDLVYVAPERVRSRFFLEALAKTRIQLLAIDEAHCISQWGHDFRPDYARLGRMRERIGRPQTIALTATATETVRRDVMAILELREPAVFVSGFARDNLSLAVKSPAGNSDKDRMLIEFLSHVPGAGIVYCSTRKACEHVTELLHSVESRKVGIYHAGLEQAERRNVQDRFANDGVDIIVATNAFGMGIDKSDLRFVVHYNLPGSVEAYYQEAGRAGRDGKPADCCLFYSYQDKFIQEFFIENSYPSSEIVQQVYEYLCEIEADPIEITLQDLQQQLGLSIGTEGIRVCETLLEKCGALERMDSQQNLASVKIDSPLTSNVDRLPRDAKTRRRVLRGVESMIGPLREERVFFSPRWLCQQLDMKWESVQRALRELSKLDFFDYVPPFRGRAIHMLRRAAFHELEIDFDELKRRKREEYRRLESVMRFAGSRACRQMDILEYFGDASRQPCGHCDNCRGQLDVVQNSLDIGDHSGCLYAVQVALSGVARTHGRVGKTLIAQMLCGSGAKKLKQLGLSKLSTHGMLKSLGRAESVQLLDCLLAMQLISQEERQKFRPIVKVTRCGLEVMQGRDLGRALSGVPQDLQAKLNFLFRGQQPIVDQTSLAGSEKDSTVVQPVEGRPAEPRQLRVDNEEVDTGTDSHREPEPQIRRRDESHGVSAPMPEVVHSFESADVSQNRPDFYWTWQLLTAGYSVSEVSQIRKLSIREIANHLEIAEENQFEIDPDWMSAKSL